MRRKRRSKKPRATGPAPVEGAERRRDDAVARDQSKSKSKSTSSPDVASSEDTRFCVGCNAVVNIQAVYCEFCGAKLSAPTAVERAEPRLDDPLPDDDLTRDLAEFDSRESRQLARELVAKHHDLLRRTRKSADDLEGQVVEAGRALDVFTRRGASPERSQAIQEVLEDLEEVGDLWEALQHDYNRESEELDDEYSDRFAEVELDVSVNAELEAELEDELRGVATVFESISNLLREHGSRGQELLARSSGRFFGSDPAPSRSTGMVWILLVVATVISVAIGSYLGLSPMRAVLPVVPYVLLSWYFVGFSRS